MSSMLGLPASVGVTNIMTPALKTSEAMSMTILTMLEPLVVGGSSGSGGGPDLGVGFDRGDDGPDDGSWAGGSATAVPELWLCRPNGSTKFTGLSYPNS
jgi:hypothetical protein